MAITEALTGARILKIATVKSSRFKVKEKEHV